MDRTRVGSNGMNRHDETDDRTTASAPRDTIGRARTPEEIEHDIAAIRARMDRTLDELEFRLAPGQLVSGAVDVVQDVVRGNPGRLSQAIRSNPLPVLLIGVGALWLGITMARTRPDDAAPARLPAGTAADVLMPLIQLNRQGSDSLRQAEAVVDETEIRSLIREAAETHDRTAAALEGELRRFGGAPVVDAANPPHPAWSELRRALTTQERGTIVAAVESGEDAAIQAFRDALHRDLPDDTRVLVGAHFHAVEQIHNRIAALKQAVA
jgi:uncharacterized protein (TIGR02284 family)